MKFENPLASVTSINDLIVVEAPEQPTFKDSAKRFAKSFVKGFVVSFVATSAILLVNAAIHANNTEDEETETEEDSDK